MRRVAVLTSVFAMITLAAWGTAQAHAAVTLHQGSKGKQVAALQWLLTGNAPSHYSTIHPLRGRKPTRVYGKRTGAAVAAAKWKLGYPAGRVNRTAGRVLFDVLIGKRRRPLGWIQTAAKRQATLDHEEAAAKVSACQRHVVQIAESQVGVREIPDGSNWGPQVADYQAVTGAYHAAWCASFAQWVLVHAGYGPFADRSAGVFYIRDWAYHRGLLRATPRPGVLVLFLNSTGHMGIVERVVQGGFYSIEGNSGNMVARRFHTFTRATVFVYLPHCSAASQLVAPPTGFAASVTGRVPVWLLILLSGAGWLLTPPHHLVRRWRGR